ncbi:PLP-dependent aspartate aminotransferase family protein [bacterium]|nr:PLP-dependent aspartate aminotransferase family protein [bacterium]MBU1985051.1 PLP-dependent aspartate aminotransferase family protein [bacterium]
MEDSKRRDVVSLFYLKYGFATRCLHAGEKVGQPKSKSHTNAIFQTSTFTFDDAEEGADIFAQKREGFVYTRMGNPTVVVAEAKLNSLEGREIKLADPQNVRVSSLLFSSGMAATSSLTYALLKPGDVFLRGEVLYGSTDHFFVDVAPKFGMKPVIVNTCKPGALKKAIKAHPKAKLLFFETPTNPLLEITDIAEAVQTVKAVNPDCMVCVDNTFATPYLQQPFNFGVDVIMHSTTKYLSGHGTIVGGALITKHDWIKDALYKIMKDHGPSPSPFDCWLLNLGMKTLPIRMEKSCRNAMAVARFLDKHPKVEKVYYPGLETHPHHEIAKKQMRDFGAMVGFDIKGGYACAQKIMNNMHVFSLAVSLGCVDSLIQHPASMTHASMSPEARAHAGIGDGNIRLSIGIEDEQDLIHDLEQALKKC